MKKLQYKPKSRRYPRLAVGKRRWNEGMVLLIVKKGQGIILVSTNSLFVAGDVVTSVEPWDVETIPRNTEIRRIFN